MTAELLVLQFVDDGKLTVDDAVQLLETLALAEEKFPVWDETPSPITLFIISGNG